MRPTCFESGVCFDMDCWDWRMNKRVDERENKMVCKNGRKRRTFHDEAGAFRAQVRFQEPVATPSGGKGSTPKIIESRCTTQSISHVFERLLPLPLHPQIHFHNHEPDPLSTTTLNHQSTTPQIPPNSTVPLAPSNPLAPSISTTYHPLISDSALWKCPTLKEPTKSGDLPPFNGVSNPHRNANSTNILRKSREMLRKERVRGPEGGNAFRPTGCGNLGTVDDKGRGDSSGDFVSVGLVKVLVVDGE